MEALTPAALAICAAGLAAGGFVKGVIGVALPVAAIPIMTAAVTVPQAVALLAVPILAANIWQSGGVARVGNTMRRFWPLLIPLVIGLAVGTRLLVGIPAKQLYLIIGAAVIAVAAAQLMAPRLVVSPRQERWLGPLVGAFAGLIGGVSSMFGTAIATYMIALRLPREEFIGSTAAAFLCAGVPLTILLALNGVYDWPLFLLSIAACVPVFAGLLVGTAIRRRIDPHGFHRLVLAALVLIGLELLRRGLS
jgi:uncharacterized protein